MICSVCGLDFEKKRKHGRVCRPCKNEKQRKNRRLTENKHTRKYEKTKSGFLMRLYRNMFSRVTGIQKKKRHLYYGKEILAREDFYVWANKQKKFHALFSVWKRTLYKRRLCPTVNRIDPRKGYIISNMEWLTHSENSRLGSAKK